MEAPRMSVLLGALHVASLGFEMPGRLLAFLLILRVLETAACCSSMRYGFVGFASQTGELGAAELFQSLLALVVPAMSLRLGLIIATLLHEWAHLLAGCAMRGVKDYCTFANFAGNTPISVWLSILNPFRPLPASFAPHVVASPSPPESHPKLEASALAAIDRGFQNMDRIFPPEKENPGFTPSIKTSTGISCCARPESNVARAIHLTGWLASLIIFCGGQWMLSLNRGEVSHGPVFPWRDCGAEAVLGCLCCLVGASATDLVRASLPVTVGDSAFFCGNFGLLLAGTVSSLREKAVDVMAVLEAMAAVSTERGGQSGGLVTFLETSGGEMTPVRVRVCPSKRESLSHKLIGRFQWSCSLVQIWAYLRSIFTWCFQRRPRGTGRDGSSMKLFAGHTRFATSSIPSPLETHPHQWTPTRREYMWRVNQLNGCPYSSKEQVGVFVTHNGDFEFWNMFGRDRTHAEMALWLHRVLGSSAPAQCDSVVIGGLMELLRTQGLWRASLRLAFQQVVVSSYDEVVMAKPGDPCAAPSRRALEVLAAVAERTFANLLSKTTTSHTSREPEDVGNDKEDSYSDRKACGGSLWQVIKGETEAELERALHGALRSEGAAALRKASSAEQSLLAGLPEETLQMLAQQTVRNFLHNDLFWALKHFLAHAKGSFGLAVSCTLDADRVVLAAYNQPLSVGFAPPQRAVLYSSESHALKVSLQGPKTTLNGKKASAGEHISCRLDLDEADGEVLELLLLPPGHDSIAEESKGEYPMHAGLPHSLLGHVDVEGGVPSQSRAFVLENAPFVQLRLHNRRLSCAVGSEELESSGRLVNLKNNRYVALHPPMSRHDLVGQDIKSIPRILAEIRSDWASDASLNRQTAQAMFEMLREKAGARAGEVPSEGNNRREIDVLVVGVENSLWVGEQFAADLQNLFPQLRVVPMSANKVIGVMGNARGAISTAGFSFCQLGTALSSSSLVLALSQSGQTFPTLHATRILAKQCPGRVFVCVGMLDTKMAAAVGQRFATDAPFGGRIFCTNAGWRSAEAATVTAVAMHASLTELMLLLARQLRTAPGLPAAPLGLRLSRLDIVDLQRMRDALVDRGSVDITGYTAEGSAAFSATHEALIQQGFQWALHVLETPIAWGMACAYIFITVVLGVPIFTVIRKALPLSGRADDVCAYIAHALDSAVYCFLPLLCALLLRVLQGRQLLARIGMRTIVVADIPYVHQLLETYVSKLFSLSYWIASVEVHGANPIDHFVHRFTHRVKRGVLLAIGRPDGRLCSQTKCESWVLMALLQARSIVSLGAGAEAITIGHNPHTSKVIKRHLLLQSNRPQFLCERLLGVDDFEPMKRMASRRHVVQAGGGRSKFEEFDSQVVGAHLCLEGTLQRARRIGLGMVAGGRSEIDAAEIESPDARCILLGAMDLDVQRVLDSQAPLEELTENRFVSLERLLAFQVMFHKMASTVASFWPLRFDTGRSQSCLRIATTAAPVSAADLEREWQESIEDLSRDITVHRRRGLGKSMNSFGSSSQFPTKSPGASYHGSVGGSNRGISPGNTLHRILREGISSLPFARAGTVSGLDAEGLKHEGSTHHRRRLRASLDSITALSQKGGISSTVLRHSPRRVEPADRTKTATVVPTSREEEGHKEVLQRETVKAGDSELAGKVEDRTQAQIPRPESRVWGGDGLRQILGEDGIGDGDEPLQKFPFRRWTADQ